MRTTAVITASRGSPCVLVIGRAGVSTFVIGAVLHVAGQTKVPQHHAVHRRHQHVAGCDVPARRQRAGVRTQAPMLPVSLFSCMQNQRLQQHICLINPLQSKPPGAEDNSHQLLHPHCHMLEKTREATLCVGSCSQGFVTLAAVVRVHLCALTSGSIGGLSHPFFRRFNNTIAL